METNTQNNVLLSWNAPERIPVARGKRWYAVMGTIFVASGVWSILSAAWTLTIVIILGSAMYYQVIRSRLETKEIQITTRGLRVGDDVSPWELCTGFWIYRQGAYTVLHIEKRGWQQEIVAVIDGPDYQSVAQAIGRFLPYQSERREKVLDYIIRVCKL